MDLGVSVFFGVFFPRFFHCETFALVKVEAFRFFALCFGLLFWFGA